MRLIRFGSPGNERPGLLTSNGSRVDVSHVIPDYDEEFFANDGLSRLEAMDVEHCPVIENDVRLGPPVGRPSKIVCIGLNFVDHARESGLEPPAEPVIFFKATSSLVGPNDDLIIPVNGEKTDWEVELAVVIGQRASYVAEADAMAHVAGYVMHNDYSERAFQLERCGQWVKGKSCDSFAPLGPFLATCDEIADVDNLRMWLSVNGSIKQEGSTRNLIFKIPYLVSYVSQFMTLLPGDIISTGTPAGVGLGFDPPQFLKAGDTVELGIEGLGTSRQVARSYRQT